MPVCLECNSEKDIISFSYKNKKLGVRHKRCKECMAIATHKHYIEHKEDYIWRAKRDRKNQKDKKKKIIGDVKLKCVICDEDWPAALDFHHKGQKEKEILISPIHSQKKIKNELKKCIVLCANHHRK